MRLDHHLDLLSRSTRSQGLQAAIKRVVFPGARVLDAGTGTGLLAVWAAKAGAARVVAVDLEHMDIARSLARDNDCDRVIEFVQADLNEVAFDESFDVLLGMIYFNDPRRDERQSEIIFSLSDRFLKKEGRPVPERVRYTAYACAWEEQDIATRWSKVEERIGGLEVELELNLGALRGIMGGLPPNPYFPSRRPDGGLNRESAQILSDPVLFTELDYRRGAQVYPEKLQLPIARAGQLNTVVWVQELLFEEIVIFRNESLTWVGNSRPVEKGQTYWLAIDDKWRRSNVLTAIG